MCKGARSGRAAPFHRAVTTLAHTGDMWNAPSIALAVVLIFSGTAFALHLASLAITGWRARLGQDLPPPHCPPVTILRPVKGLENFIEETLRTSFELDYPAYELIFCVAQPDDPIVARVRALMAAYPAIPSRLLIGDERVGANPKLNNLVKGWSAARHDWIVMADSNVLMPPDYLQRMLARWDRSTGLVASPPVGARPQGFWGELECAFLNSFAARWQLCADAVGFGFAQGKSMLWHKPLLEKAGGLARLSSEPAEDAAATKIVRGQGLKVRLVRMPFAQPIGARAFGEVWTRQERWAKLRRASFSLAFSAEILSGGFAPFVLGAVAVALGEMPAWLFGLCGGLWYAAEAATIALARWPLSPATLLALPLRDLLFPAIWLAAWLRSDFHWRGNDMSAGQSGAATGRAIVASRVAVRRYGGALARRWTVALRTPDR